MSSVKTKLLSFFFFILFNQINNAKSTHSKSMDTKSVVSASQSTPVTNSEFSSMSSSSKDHISESSQVHTRKTKVQIEQQKLSVIEYDESRKSPDNDFDKALNRKDLTSAKSVSQNKQQAKSSKHNAHEDTQTDDHSMESHEAMTTGIEEDEDYILLDSDEEETLIDLEQQHVLIDKIKSMSKEAVEVSIKKLISKSSLNTQKFAESPVIKQLETGLVITRYFYIKKNFSKELLDLVSFLRCNLSFKTEEKEYEAVTVSSKSKKVLKKVKEPYVSIERDEPINTKYQYRFSYDVVGQFNDAYWEYCRQVDNFIEPMKNMLYDFKGRDSKGSEDLNLDSFLGKKIEKLIRENKKNFEEFGEKAFETSTEMLKVIKNIDCNLKDMMAFYQLLPRFFLLYRRMKDKLESMEDPVVMYYGEQLVEIHAKWLATNNELFGYIGSFNVWLILNQGLFKMPYSFPSDDFFKISMIEMMSKSMIELTLEKDRFRTAIRNVYLRYKDIYNSLKVFFEGIEEYLYIKVPFEFPQLGSKAHERNLPVFGFILGALLLWIKA